MDQQDCSRRIASALENLGILPGDTILVHSSFKSLGVVPGGIETVIRGLAEAVGADGTLLMPALSWALRPPEIFDVETTPTNVGAIPEFFRTYPGVRRSLHPTHSVCVLGRRVLELLDGHELDSTPCGMHSPFRKLAETHGKIVMLGCGLGPNTTMHALEEYVEPPYLYGPVCRFTLKDSRGSVWHKEYKTHGFKSHGYAQRYDRITRLDDVAFLRKGRVLDAATFVLDAPGLKKSVLAALDKDVFFFVEKY